jgi:predicted DNA-binding transcriptional regulator YafY
MPKKRAPDSSPAMKLMAAYWLLLFSRRAWTLPELADKLECSKQTVQRIMNHIDASGYAPLESGVGSDRRRWYRLMRPKERPAVALSIEDIQSLLLCRDIAWNLLPGNLRKTVSTVIGHTSVLLPDSELINELFDGNVCPPFEGRVNYEDKGDAISCLMRAMHENRVCEIEYRAIDSDTARVHEVAPRRLVPYKDSLYVMGWLLKDEKTVYKTTLAIQRVAKVTITDESYEKKWPSDATKGFGIIKDEPFRVKAAFTSIAACYVSERLWSEDQALALQPDGGVILTFTATSWPEVVAWALSYGNNVTVLEPKELKEEVKKTAEKMVDLYK